MNKIVMGLWLTKLECKKKNFARNMAYCRRFRTDAETVLSQKVLNFHSGTSKKLPGNLGSFSDDSDDDDGHNPDYPFMSFRDPNSPSSSHSQVHSSPQEDQGSNNHSSQQSIPNDGTFEHSQSLNESDGEIVPENLDYFINSPTQAPNINPHTSTLMQDLPNMNQSNLEIQVQGGGIPTSRVHKNHPISQIIGPLNERTMRSQTEQANICLSSCFLSQVVPKNI